MIKRISGILAITLLALSAILSPVVSYAQEDGRLYVAETGHWISNDFLTKYRSVPDPQAIFGYPITEAFVNQTTGHIVQYFQRALFELHPDQPAELRVDIKMLGEFLFEEGTPLPIPQNFPACHYFYETNHQVCYAFLDFFKSNGGLAIFGYPISDVQILDGRMVQYFQRARFEWHPELPTGKRVILADLGQRYFDIRHEDLQRLKPSKNDQIIHTVLSLQARAFPENAVVATQGIQSLYVLVQDQNLLPVSNATVILNIKYPSGVEKNQVASTDGNGITKIQFALDEQSVGIVEVNVQVTYGILEQTTRTSFRIWW